MKTECQAIYYDQTEEKINTITHAFGLLFSVIALVFLIIKASLYGDAWHVVSFSTFGISLVILYSASTLYHSSKTSKTRARLKIFDHASIYVLIAGTYTPFALVTLSGKTGWWIFGTTWLFALTGIILKLFFTGKYGKLSTLMYVLMGWIILFAIKPLINNLSIEGFFWLFTGGISYTLGAILYSFDEIKFNHAIFHIFVLVGSFCHFVSVYYYVLKV
uniref:Hemolysin-3 family protein n=1 Tax=uncultured organism TaxID=155900 RepID=E3T2Z5_9ZZZZ|nr:hemolysin-3 family protein [uncultured organism]